MAKIFKPRRALRSSVKSGSKRTLVLASGELMLVGKTAIGEGSKADLYLGDGVSQIQNLSPAMYGDTSEEDMTITDDTSTTASAALGNVTTGKTLGAILGSLKKAISLNAAAITTLNDDTRTLKKHFEFINANNIDSYLTLGTTTATLKFTLHNKFCYLSFELLSSGNSIYIVSTRTSSYTLYKDGRITNVDYPVAWNYGAVITFNDTIKNFVSGYYIVN